MEKEIKKVLEKICLSGEVSTNLIQRKFNIGYAVAGDFLDILETNKIIEPWQENKPRKILNKEEFMIIGQKYFNEIFSKNSL
jgi:DNA segregation ATPase FtsK/SpoIIIE-like protein